MPVDGLIARHAGGAPADRLRVPPLRRRRVPAPGLVRRLHVERRRGAPARPPRDAVDLDDPVLPAEVPALRRRPGRRSSPTASATSSCPGELRVEARLTEADPARLRIGMSMELVLIPAPGGDGALTYAFRRWRTSSSVAVVGVGIHPFGRHEGVSGLEMAAVAARAALRDAGVGWQDVEFAAGGSDAAGNADTTVVGARASPACRSSTSATAARPAGPRSRRRTRCSRPARRRSRSSSASTSTRRARSTRGRRTGGSAPGTARPASCSRRSSSR